MMCQEKGKHCVINLDKTTVVPVEKSKLLRFVIGFVSTVTVLAGLIFLMLGVTVFTSGWYSLSQSLKYHELETSVEDYQGTVEYGSGSEDVDDEVVENVVVNMRSFIIICTIASIVSEISTALIICNAIVAHIHRTIRSHFKLKRNNILLNSLAFFLVGICIFYLALAFTEMHCYILTANTEDDVVNNEIDIGIEASLSTSTATIQTSTESIFDMIEPMKVEKGRMSGGNEISSEESDESNYSDFYDSDEYNGLESVEEKVEFKIINATIQTYL